ncbi:hypothetical protein N7532_008928 [Penicillium argentinense]|uniref:Uncharacterized protein n=1 Tax=Penicillium argentinense TaxID=1131581 RepID=A0A9W9EYB8_9EURO|nr:uncharacterized protein N7532_008928 [Penicillium argentinense]KAJ5090244.1 hypothetical protein N7532_008928 [Penicillium argentinense]
MWLNTPPTSRQPPSKEQAYAAGACLQISGRTNYESKLTTPHGFSKCRPRTDVGVGGRSQEGERGKAAEELGLTGTVASSSRWLMTSLSESAQHQQEVLAKVGEE